MATASTPPGFADITIDGQPVRVPAGTTVFDAARMNGINIPTLCHLQNQTPVGVCRLCVVETGARVLAASCVRLVEPGMKVVTNSEKVLGARKILLELMMSDHPSPCARQQNSGDCELETLAKAAGASQPRFAKRTIARGKDDSSLAIAVDHDACILCDRCIRGCDEVKSNFVLGRMGKGYSAGIAFDLNSPMGDSTCISCGECMVSCPTGALTNKSVVGTAITVGPDAQGFEAEDLLQIPFSKASLARSSSSIAAPSSSAASAKAKSSPVKVNLVQRLSTFSKAMPKSPSPLPSPTSRPRAAQKVSSSG
jgi:predicted molibdopterin-dependent oxidoreductase YjgC